jgi:phytoene/squalene synthetase
MLDRMAAWRSLRRPNFTPPSRDDIEAHDYDVFTRRAHLTAWGKLRRLPGIWWRVRDGSWLSGDHGHRKPMVPAGESV